MRHPTETGDLWWKNAVVYCLDVETFADGNGDGIGDFSGATDRLTYLSSLGVTCIWLMPFFPTPNHDDGYDITDFMAVDERLGSLGDFVTFLRAARERGLRVVTDLVVNHTSVEHPWFVSARSAKSSPHRDWYVWSDEPVEEAEEIIFPGEQKTNWTYDESSGQYYFHRFMPHQPDLNFSNPEVREEIDKIVGFWLQLGVSGFRIDAAPYLIETVGPHGKPRAKHHEWLKDLRAFASSRQGDAVLIGEANMNEPKMADFFGDGHELHLLFNFSASAGLLHSLATQSADPLRRELDQLPDVPPACAWLNFARVHDELNLDRLEEPHQQEVFDAFAPEESMRLYDRGLRRRLAPMLDGDRRRLELAYSLIFSLPGTPMLFYGDEIGMGDNLELPGRMAARTPMQWSADPSGGFSTAEPERLVRPLVSEKEFSPEAVNVSDQRRDRDSMLSWVRRLTETRLETPAIGLGTWEAVDTGDDAVLGHTVTWQDERVVLLHNFADTARELTLDCLDDYARAAVAFGDEGPATVEGPPESVTLGPYGYRWIRATKDPRRPLL